MMPVVMMKTTYAAITASRRKHYTLTIIYIDGYDDGID